MTVLLVDDDALVLRGFARLLARRGWETSLATGTEALSGAGRFDVAVVDLGLEAGLDGAAVGRALLDAGRARHVVFFSGDPSSARAARARALGPVVGKDQLDTLLGLLGSLASAPTRVA